jgi:hypothetical protein
LFCFGEVKQDIPFNDEVTVVFRMIVILFLQIRKSRMVLFLVGLSESSIFIPNFVYIILI